MDRQQFIIGGGLAAAVLGLGIFYGVRQIRLLRQLRTDPQEGAEPTRFQMRQAKLRLVNSGLMIVLGLLLIGVLVFLEAPAQRLADQREAEGRTDEPLTQDQKSFARLYGWSWVAIMALLMVIVLFAAADVWTTRRYALSEQKKIREGRRDVVQRQLARMRRDDNGHF